VLSFIEPTLNYCKKADLNRSGQFSINRLIPKLGANSPAIDSKLNDSYSILRLDSTNSQKSALVINLCWISLYSILQNRSLGNSLLKPDQIRRFDSTGLIGRWNLNIRRLIIWIRWVEFYLNPQSSLNQTNLSPDFTSVLLSKGSFQSFLSIYTSLAQLFPVHYFYLSIREDWFR